MLTNKDFPLPNLLIAIYISDNSNEISYEIIYFLKKIQVHPDTTKD